jgi:hypothetical protein
MEHEHELVHMQVLQFETLYGKPNQEDQKFAILT